MRAYSQRIERNTHLLGQALPVRNLGLPFFLVVFQNELAIF
jgi:hypothetical protein